ncbi:MAG: response regulator transcription factor [Bacteroidetes bacterium]|nr:response regulator transcription factor [Bacteroidota bacterium]
MIKALIIDDEENLRVILARYLKEHCPEISVVGEANSVASGVNAINKYVPDIIFLDVMMPDGTGFNLLEHFVSIYFKIIFITAHNDFAIKAFKFSAVDYLLKPLNIDELKIAVKKITDQPALDSSKKIIEVLLDNIANQKSVSKKIVLSSQESDRIVPIDNILRCEAKESYTLFYLISKEIILITKTLKEYDGLLGEYGFIRVHKSHLINSKYIKKYVKNEAPYIIMEDNAQIPVSRRKKDELRNQLKKINI